MGKVTSLIVLVVNVCELFFFWSNKCWQYNSNSLFNGCLSRLLHTHTHLTALFPGLPGWASTRKVKPIWILLKQETVSGSGISWAMCKSAPRSWQITTPEPHHSVFLQAECPSCHPTNSVKALKVNYPGCYRWDNTVNTYESQNTDAQGTRAPTTTLYVLCGLQEGVQLYLPW